MLKLVNMLIEGQRLLLGHVTFWVISYHHSKSGTGMRRTSLSTETVEEIVHFIILFRLSDTSRYKYKPDIVCLCIVFVGKVLMLTLLFDVSSTIHISPRLC